VECDADGCISTMHPMCVHQFESDIQYDSDDGKEEGKHFCPMHHPMKARLEDDDDKSDSDDLEKKLPSKPRAVVPTLPSFPPLLLPMPPLPEGQEPAGQECDWRLSATGCVHPELVPLKCQREGCNVLVHHLCQNNWHESIMYEPDTIARFCRIHDTRYAITHQLPVAAHNDKFDFGLLDDMGESSDDDDKGTNSNHVPGNYKENDSDGSNDDDDSIDNGNDDCDSADDGMEANELCEGMEFEDRVDDDIDDTTGVDFVATGLLGAPLGWFPPAPPENHKYVPVNGAPAEEDVDNPGGWNSYSFAARYNSNAKTKKYVGHFTPSGARVVPENNLGVRQIDEWKFYYQGWTADDFDKGTYVRGDAVYGNLKPASRKGSLDVDVLRKHGLTMNRMIDNDALFFYQLLFPISDPKSSGVDADNRIPYFTIAAICTNVYASATGAGSGVGHHWRSVTAEELVHWTACPIRNGALDGKPGTLMQRWNKDDKRFDELIANAMTEGRWRQVNYCCDSAVSS
jgi:hypothetical protein